MKVLVCGDRFWTDRAMIYAELSKLSPGTIIVHGGARGADSIAGEIAKELGFVVRAYPADWSAHGKAAGPIRNSTMLVREHRPDEPVNLVLAFHYDLAKSKGTKDMVRKSKNAGISVRLPALSAPN